MSGGRKAWRAACEAKWMIAVLRLVPGGRPGLHSHLKLAISETTESKPVFSNFVKSQKIGFVFIST